ncbi:hypothetical protein J6590_011502 [Homalodisca vitripennis]|nr:hypothetical protein J6590_011502 [Homalodisca vitripennis]
MRVSWVLSWVAVGCLVTLGWAKPQSAEDSNLQTLSLEADAHNHTPLCWRDLGDHLPITSTRAMAAAIVQCVGVMDTEVEVDMEEEEVIPVEEEEEEVVAVVVVEVVEDRSLLSSLLRKAAVATPQVEVEAIIPVAAVGVDTPQVEAEVVIPPAVVEVVIPPAAVEVVILMAVEAVVEAVVAEEASKGATSSGVAEVDTLEAAAAVAVVPPAVDVEAVDLSPIRRHKVLLLLPQELGNLGNNLTM